MESSGLPIPTVGSEPLSSVLLQLSSQGLKLMPPQTRIDLLITTGKEHITGTPTDSLSSLYQNGGFLETQNQKKLKRNSEEHSLSENGPLVENDVLPEKPVTALAYEPGSGAERLKQYMLQQRNRPKDNNIQFWRNFVAEFFAPSGMKRWCVSLYKNSKKNECLFSKVAWQCDLCSKKPCRGFEIYGEILPRLHKMKYDIGLLDEWLHHDSCNEYQCLSGNIILTSPEAIEETEYDQVRIIHYGQLRVIFSSDLKICSWEFCAQLHKEYIPRKSIVPQIRQLGSAVQNYKLSTEESSSVPPEELQKSTDLIASSAHEMVLALKMPFVGNLGIVKRYQRCVQISEVFNLMKDLIDYSQETRTSPKESLVKFPSFESNSSSAKNTDQQHEQEQSSPNFPSFSDGIAFTCNGLGNKTAASTSIEPNNQKKQCIGDPSDSRTTAERIIQEIMATQPCNNKPVGIITSHNNVDENSNEVMPIGKKACDEVKKIDTVFSASTSGVKSNHVEKGYYDDDDQIDELMDFDELQELLKFI